MKTLSTEPPKRTKVTKIRRQGGKIKKRIYIFNEYPSEDELTSLEQILLLLNDVTDDDSIRKIREVLNSLCLLETNPLIKAAKTDIAK